MEDGIVFVDTKLYNKQMLHKLIENGGTIKFNNIGIFGLSHNPNNPESQMVELKLGFAPAGQKFKGHVNPTLSKKVYKKPEKAKIEIVEDEVEEM